VEPSLLADQESRQLRVTVKCLSEIQIVAQLSTVFKRQLMVWRLDFDNLNCLSTWVRQKYEVGPLRLRHALDNTAGAISPALVFVGRFLDRGFQVLVGGEQFSSRLQYPRKLRDEL